jgi:hypothetical protein
MRKCKYLHTFPYAFSKQELDFKRHTEGYKIKLITVKYYNHELKCGDLEAFQLVGELCDGQLNCTFMADDNLFEDSECADEIPERLRCNLLKK